jgi:hypothetical protein
VIESREAKTKALSAFEAPARVGTGLSLWDSMNPERKLRSIHRGELWAAVGSRPSPVIDPTTEEPIALFEDGIQCLSLSPDGSELVTIVAIPDVPQAWERRFPPPFPQAAIRVRGGRQNLDASSGWGYVGEYARINLVTGSTSSLTNGPEAVWAGWDETLLAQPAWSSDGAMILLPGTFIRSEQQLQDRPCVAVVSVRSQESVCVRPLKRELPTGFERSYARMDEIRFEGERADRILLKHSGHGKSEDDQTWAYERNSKGDWSLLKTGESIPGPSGIQVRVRASFKEPPVLVAQDPHTARSRIVLDPNPQLKLVAFGQSDLYRWKDRTGREWEGILYKPIGFRHGVRYPLVLQNHGFNLDRYVPSGGFPTAFVAEELASVGIMVLQVRDCDGRDTPGEGPCNVAGYEAAVSKLADDGMVDPSQIGIIGFSRTVFYVLEALTTSKLHFKAASITDGITLGYMDYLCNGPSNAITRMFDAMMGSRPVGSGLQRWFINSPVFQLTKSTTPLRIVSARGTGLLEMWEPYAILEMLHKPVDLIVLNTEQHVITDPRVRFVAQEGNVDWFRFWLQGFEDPDPAKKDQYERWRSLRTDAHTPGSARETTVFSIDPRQRLG